MSAAELKKKRDTKSVGIDLVDLSLEKTISHTAITNQPEESEEKDS